MAAETEQIFINMGIVLKNYSLDYSNIFKCTVMMDDISEWAAFNNVYKKYFSKPYPVRSAFGGSKLAFGAKVELECIAQIKASTH